MSFTPYESRFPAVWKRPGQDAPLNHRNPGEDVPPGIAEAVVRIDDRQTCIADAVVQVAERQPNPRQLLTLPLYGF